MKKFYYFSKSKLKFVEIRSFYKKFVFLVSFFSVLVSFFIFGTYLIFNEIINPNSELKTLKKTNELLKSKLQHFADKYESLDKQLFDISSKSKELRLVTNLDKIEDDEIFGIGGSVFEPISKSPAELSDYLNDLENYINNVSLKVKFEKNNFNEIESALKQNSLMYDAIPAITPCTGRIADDFGMRFHPILKITRMHNGIDIITDIGTKVYSPGGGVVEFAGRRGGHGITIEINHGFGYSTLYSHLSKIAVKEGQKIKRGDLIAYTGNTGQLTTGPHLHYEVRHNGVALNPRNFIYDDINLFEIVKK